MSSSIRPDRRSPICCPVTDHAGLREGRESVDEWVPFLRRCAAGGWADLSLDDRLPRPAPPLFVAAVNVRWVRGQEYSVETAVVASAANSESSKHPLLALVREDFRGFASPRSP